MADNTEITSENAVTARRLAGVVEGVWGKVRTITDKLNTDKAPLASPELTGTPTAPTAADGTNTTQIATTAFVNTAVEQGMAIADAMIYKGTVAGGDTSDYGALTPAASKGWTYKVTTAGKIDGIAVEVGDILICNTDDTAAATSSNYATIAANWDFVQANIDGAVTGPAHSVSGNVAIFNSANGKVISDSGAAIDDSYDSDHDKVATHKTIKAAIETLDVNDITANLGAGKTITALSETDGKIAATASNIQITESQVTDLTTDLNGKANKVSGAVTGNFASLDANGNLADSGSKASDFKTKQTAVTDPTADGDTLAFIDSITQNENGEIVVTKKNVDKVEIVPNPDTDNTILTGESDGTYDWQPMEKSAWGTVITDGENNLVDENGNAIMDENEVDLWTTFKGVGFGAERAAADVEGNPIVDTYATKQEVSELSSEVDRKINALDMSAESLGKGKTITSLSQTDGLVSATAEDIEIVSAQVSDKMATYDGTGSDKGKLVTGEAVKAALDTLDAEITSNDGTNVQVKVTETNGKITAVSVSTDNTENKNNKVTAFQATPDDTHYPSEKLVKDSLDSKVPTSRTVNGHSLSSDVTVTKADVGLGNVNNTAISVSASNGVTDSTNNVTYKYEHPTSTEAGAAAVKVGRTNLGHVVLGDALTKSDVGLGNVDNTSDATKKTNFTGAIADDNTGFVTGNDVYDALALKAPLASPALTGTPTAPTATAGTDNDQIATTSFVKQAVIDGMATADALTYKGTVDGGSTGEYGALTPEASKGDVYKVTTAGKIDGVKVKVGDMLICNTDNTAAATSSNYSTIAANWDFVQTNLDGVVIGPASATSGNIALFDGGTGKLIKNSSISDTDVADAVSKRHSHSSLTLSTTAQKYDGTNTLALPSSDPYTSARTPTSHTDTTGAYGKGTTSNYGHVKLATGDMNGATNEDGVAVSKNHTHSQYLTSHQSLSDYLTKTGDGQNVTVDSISDESSRTIFAAGEKLSKILGKIKKYLGDLKAVAFSGSYSDLSGTPDINNGTLTIKQNNTSVGTFTANQSSNSTIELTDTTKAEVNNNASGNILFTTNSTSGTITPYIGNNLSVDTAKGFTGVMAGTIGADATLGFNIDVSGFANHIIPANSSNTIRDFLSKTKKLQVDVDNSLTTLVPINCAIEGNLTEQCFYLYIYRGIVDEGVPVRLTVGELWKVIKNFIASNSANGLGLDKNYYQGTALKAISDGDENIIKTTYAKRTALSNKSTSAYNELTVTTPDQNVYLYFEDVDMYVRLEIKQVSGIYYYGLVMKRDASSSPIQVSGSAMLSSQASGQPSPNTEIKRIWASVGKDNWSNFGHFTILQADASTDYAATGKIQFKCGSFMINVDVSITKAGDASSAYVFLTGYTSPCAAGNNTIPVV